MIRIGIERGLCDLPDQDPIKDAVKEYMAGVKAKTKNCVKRKSLSFLTGMT